MAGVVVRSMIFQTAPAGRRQQLGLKMSEQTFGEKAVGLSFNPSGDDAVAQCKREFAQAIDRMHALRETSDNPDVKRMASVAITDAQAAQMWAVKAITWRA